MLRLDFIPSDDPDETIARSIVIVSETDVDVDENEPNYYIPIDVWSRKQYVENWLKSIDELETNGKGSFILLADVVESDSSFECYVAWRSSEGYVFQNDWLIQDEIDEPINIETTWKYIKDKPYDDMDEINISQSDLDKIKHSLMEYLENN